MANKKAYVLYDAFHSQRHGAPLFLCQETVVGPGFTDNLERARRFESRREAAKTRAFRHKLCFFEIRTLDEARELAAPAAQSTTTGEPTS